MQGHKALAREPVLHFLLLGCLLFAGQHVWQSSLRGYFYPEVIFITTATEKKLGNQWASETGKPPTEKVLQALVQQQINNELLFQDAIKKRLHYGDPVIHQRLIQNIRFINPKSTQNDHELLEQAYQLGMLESDLVVRRRLIQKNLHHIESNAVVTAEMLEKHLSAASTERSSAVRYHFQQLFFSSEAAARQAARQLEADPASPLTGEAFLLGPEHRFLSRSEIERRFGSQFANHLADSSVGEWLPVVQSTYGYHLIRILALRMEPSANAENRRAQILSRLYAEQDEAAVQNYLEKLRRTYHVVLESAEASP